LREHFRKEEKYNKNNYRGFSMESAVFLLYGILLTYIIYHSQSNAYLYSG